MSDLIDRLIEATAPSRELDEAICEALMGWPEPEWRSIDYMKTFGLPVTSSVDAAIELAERVLPGWRWLVRSHNSKGFANVYLIHPTDIMDDGSNFPTFAATPAIALVLAVLTAKQAEGLTP